MILRVAKWHGKSPKPNLDATTVNDRQDKYKRTSIKLHCLDSHDSIKARRNVMQGSDECRNRIHTLVLRNSQRLVTFWRDGRNRRSEKLHDLETRHR